MSKKRPPIHQIELRLVELSALFNSMDPTPFLHRDLDVDAREFLESWALEFPRGSHFQIIVHIENMPQENPEAMVAEAIHNYFQDRAVLVQRNLRLMLLEGRTSLLIGLSFLALCLLGADALSAYADNTLLKVLKESLVIFGWVAMWRPIQIFLYDWWPLIRRRRIYQNLHNAKVSVLPGKRRHA